MPCSLPCHLGAVPNTGCRSLHAGDIWHAMQSERGHLGSAFSSYPEKAAHSLYIGTLPLTGVGDVGNAARLLLPRGADVNNHCIALRQLAGTHMC